MKKSFAIVVKIANNTSTSMNVDQIKTSEYRIASPQLITLNPRSAIYISFRLGVPITGNPVRIDLSHGSYYALIKVDIYQ